MSKLFNSLMEKSLMTKPLSCYRLTKLSKISMELKEKLENAG